MNVEQIYNNISQGQKDIVVYRSLKDQITHSRNIDWVFDSLAPHRIIGVYDYRITKSELVDDLKASGYWDED